MTINTGADMRIDVTFQDRLGIAQEILAALAQRDFNVTAVEVEPPHIYVEAPDLDTHHLQQLTHELGQVRGVQSVRPLGMLPGAQRRLYLDALLASQPDPVFATDAQGLIVVANAAAAEKRFAGPFLGVMQPISCANVMITKIKLKMRTRVFK